MTYRALEVVQGFCLLVSIWFTYFVSFSDVVVKHHGWWVAADIFGFVIVASMLTRLVYREYLR